MKTDRLLLVTVLVATWHRVAWAPLGRLTLADILQVAFVCVLVVMRAARRDTRVASATLVTLAFGVAFLVVYLAGMVTVNTNTNTVQLVKGLVVWAVHWAFLVAMVEHLARRGAALYRQAVWWFAAGFVVNGAYGLVQYAAQTAGGVNLDA